jgi:hypothetical protein
VIVAIHQPHYLPWLRYVEKIAHSDVFVLLDDVQFTKNGWQNRTRIKSAQGWMYLTVPVLDAFGKPIKDVEINTQQRWRPKHWHALQTNYARAPYFERYRELLRPIYDRPWTSLCECSIRALEVLLPALGIRTRLTRSSELGVGGSGTTRVIDLCRALGATTYLTGDYAATNHLDVAAFAAFGIEVQPQRWQAPVYRQQFPAVPFVPDLSIVDLLFNEGERAVALLRGGESAPAVAEPSRQ